RVQGAFAAGVTLAGGKVAAHGGGQLVGQDLPQPGGALGLGAAAELPALLVSAGQGLLHHVGRIELAAQPRVEVEAGQQPQVIAVRLQAHHGPLRELMRNPRRAGAEKAGKVSGVVVSARRSRGRGRLTTRTDRRASGGAPGAAARPPGQGGSGNVRLSRLAALPRGWLAGRCPARGGEPDQGSACPDACSSPGCLPGHYAPALPRGSYYSRPPCG